MGNTDRDDWAYGGDPASGDWPPPGGPYEPQPARRRLLDRIVRALINLASRRESR